MKEIVEDQYLNETIICKTNHNMIFNDKYFSFAKK